MMVISGRVVLS